MLAARAFFMQRSSPMNLRHATRAALCALLATPAWALELHPSRSSPFDLALNGRLSGVPAGATRFVTWSELRALPVTVLEMDGEFVKGRQSLTVVFLADLMKALPVEAGSDVLLAR